MEWSGNGLSADGKREVVGRRLAARDGKEIGWQQEKRSKAAGSKKGEVGCRNGMGRLAGRWIGGRLADS